MFGKLLASPIRLLNVPLRAIEKFIGDDDPNERFLSAPLESVASAVEEVVEDDPD